MQSVGNYSQHGMPGKSGDYELGAIVRWLRTEGQWRPHAKSESVDPLLDSDAESAGLERYRLAKAELAELELAERKHTLLPREKVRDALLRWSSILRQFGEKLGKQFGNDAAELFNDSLAECQHVIDEFSSN